MHIAHQILDQSINKSTDSGSNWFPAGVKGFFKEGSAIVVECSARG